MRIFGRPTLSVVVVVYDIPREAPRTLFSLSAAYQQRIDPDDYEVIVVDNGSTPALDGALLERLDGQFRLIRIDPAPASPAPAVNRGLAAARGEVVGVMIDGARIATPGLLHFALHGARLRKRAVVAGLGWYLGGDFQKSAILAGYSRAREDALLASIDWPSDGYRLFEIGTLDESSFDGWLTAIAEANALFLPRDSWAALGGMDERFDAPGGGLVNLDTYRRAMEMEGAEPVVLLGEGTFHQLHGGVATNSSPATLAENFALWDGQYRRLRGRSILPLPERRLPTLLGTLPPSALAHFVRSTLDPPSPGLQPLGAGFDRGTWSAAAPAPSADPATTALIALAHGEFRAGRFSAAGDVARIARRHAPDEWEVQRLLSLTATWVDNHPIDPGRHVARADAYRLLGDNEAAASSYHAALAMQPDLAAAHLGLAHLRMPGDGYLVWLERIYGWLAPDTAIEVGVYHGESIALFQPPTVAIGIDPCPTVQRPLRTETHLFSETSDDFFARHRADALLAGRPLSVAFIDGLHLYEQALRDFINLEALCGPRSVVLLHDTIPLDEPTQRRVPETQFHTGDVWKVVLCLKALRPDLEVFTIPAPPTGLTVVTGLDPGSRVLSERYEEAVARFGAMRFCDIDAAIETHLNVVPADWSLVQARLEGTRAV